MRHPKGFSRASSVFVCLPSRVSLCHGKLITQSTTQAALSYTIAGTELLLGLFQPIPWGPIIIQKVEKLIEIAQQQFNYVADK